MKPIRHGIQIAFIGLILAFATACTTPAATVETSLRERDYWPTGGWRTSAPEAQGMNKAKLQRLFHLLEARGAYATVVTRHGYIVAERYWGEHDPDTLFQVFSCTKSVTSALVGIAREEGAIRSVDQKMTDFFPEWALPDIDQRKQEVTLKHVLTMTSGLAWNELNYTSPNGIFTQWIMNSDWVQFVLDRPLSDNPGEKFNYSTGSSHLLTAALRRTTGKTPMEYAKEHVFGPLGITNIRWQADPAGTQCGGFGLHMTARDMAKFGYLFLNRGLWDGRRLVPESWVDESTASHVKVGGPLEYGYQWWITGVPGTGERMFIALGYGNQAIFVIPSLDIVAAVTSFTPRDLLFTTDALRAIVKAVQ